MYKNEKFDMKVILRLRIFQILMLTQKKIFLNILTVALRLCHMFDVEKNNALGHYDYYSQSDT